MRRVIWIKRGEMENFYEKEKKKNKQEEYNERKIQTIQHLLEDCYQYLTGEENETQRVRSQKKNVHQLKNEFLEKINNEDNSWVDWKLYEVARRKGVVSEFLEDNLKGDNDSSEMDSVNERGRFKEIVRSQLSDVEEGELEKILEGLSQPLQQEVNKILKNA